MVLAMRRLSPWALVLLLACRRDEASVDPDLVPVVSSRPKPVTIEPDERIGPPDAPGLDLVGKPTGPSGKTEHVTIEDEPSESATVTAPPRRERLPSLLPGVLTGPNK